MKTFLPIFRLPSVLALIAGRAQELKVARAVTAEPDQRHHVVDVVAAGRRGDILPADGAGAPEALGFLHGFNVGQCMNAGSVQVAHLPGSLVDAHDISPMRGTAPRFVGCAEALRILRVVRLAARPHFLRVSPDVGLRLSDDVLAVAEVGRRLIGLQPLWFGRTPARSRLTVTSQAQVGCDDSLLNVPMAARDSGEIANGASAPRILSRNDLRHRFLSAVRISGDFTLSLMAIASRVFTARPEVMPMNIGV